MIKQIFDISDIKLTDSYYGKKIQSRLDAYGTKYDFCRLYGSDSGGYILIYNSSMVADGNFDRNELESFIKMLIPSTIELSSEIALQISGDYNYMPRTLFNGISSKNNIDESCVKCNALLDKIYPILEEGFGINEFDVWYTDISHRIRHNISDIYLYKSTTVTKEFDIDSFVFISHIATASIDRGKGTAGNFLRWLCGEFERQNKKVYLFAKEERRSFYNSIGFKEVGSDIIYEKIN